MPGKEYEEDVKELKAGFLKPSVDRQIVQDEYGAYLSGYSPLRNGVGKYLLGIDMRADEVAKQLKAIRVSSLIFFAFSLVMAFFIGGYVHLDRRARIVREVAKRALEKEKARMQNELESAKSVQMFLLPREAPEVPGYKINGFCRPASEVSGDFFQYYRSSDGTLTIVIGDVTGKGLQAAMLVSLVLGALQTLMREAHSPAEVLAYLNAIIRHEVKGKGSATCLIGRLSPEEGRFAFSNAGHIPPYHYRSRDGGWREWKGDLLPNLPLGLEPGAAYDTHSLKLEPGDGMLLITDGAVEAMDPERRMFGFGGLAAFLQERSHEGIRTGALLLEEVLKYQVNAPQADDITVVSLTRHEIYA